MLDDDDDGGYGGGGAKNLNQCVRLDLDFYNQ